MPDWPDEARLAAATEKIREGLASSERALLESNPDYAQAVRARALLKACAGLAVDAQAVVKAVEEAAALLGQAEEKARAAREIEKLQLYASASALLHRELQAFLDLAARQKAARPRSVSLDPAPPVAAEPAPPPAPPAPPKLRLKDFAAFRQSPSGRRRLLAMWALLALFVAAAVRAAFFAGPSVEEVEAPQAAQVRISGKSASVTVQKGWNQAALPSLIESLRARNVESAAILGVGQLDVKSGKLYGARTPAPPSSAPASR